MFNLLFSTKGRISRGMFWLGYLPIFVGTAPLIIGIEKFANNNPILVLLVMVTALWIVICLGAKRFHDMGASGWFGVLTLIPLIAIIVGLIPGNTEKNDYDLAVSDK